MTGASLPGLAQVRSGGQGRALEGALGDVVTSHVQQFVGRLGQRQDWRQLVDDDRSQVLLAVVLALVTDPGAQPYQAAGLQSQLGADREVVRLVGRLGGDDLDRAGRAGLGAVGVLDSAGVRAEGGAVGAMEEDGRTC